MTEEMKSAPPGDPPAEASSKAPGVLAPIDALYEAMLAAHGQTPLGVGWGDGGSQTLRFEMLARILDGESASVSINDLGSGLGDFFSYLDQRSDVDMSAYFGVDVCAAMVSAASKRISDPRAHFSHDLVLSRRADYSFASGTYNASLDLQAENWTHYVEQSLLNMANASKKGFAFNMLSSYAQAKEKNLYFGDPLYFFDFCMGKISPHVSLIHDYPLYEWTLHVRF